MEFFKRLVNRMLEPAEDPYDSPVQESIQSCVQLMKKLERALQSLNRAREQLRSHSRELNERASAALSRARADLTLGREDFAKAALTKRHMILREVRGLEERLNETEREEQRIATVRQRLAEQLDEYRTRRELLSAHQEAAEAQIAAGEAMGGIADGPTQLNKALELAETNKKNTQARVEAINELIRSGVLDDPGMTGPQDPMDLMANAADLQEAERELERLMNLDTPDS